MKGETMKTITISGNWRDKWTSEWAGTGTVDKYGAVECSADCGDDVYSEIEDQLADGQAEGAVTVERDGRRVTYQWDTEAED